MFPLCCRSVDEMTTPYIFPQECGGRADTAWTVAAATTQAVAEAAAAVTAAAGERRYANKPLGLLMAPWKPGPQQRAFQQQQKEEEEGVWRGDIVQDISSSSSSGDGTFQFSISRYSWQQLAAAKHQHELKEGGSCLHVHLDVAHMGVGGDDSWSPSVHEEYLVAPGCYRCHLALVPMGPGEMGDVQAVASALKGKVR